MMSVSKGSDRKPCVSSEHGTDVSGSSGKAPTVDRSTETENDAREFFATSAFQTSFRLKPTASGKHIRDRLDGQHIGTCGNILCCDSYDIHGHDSGLLPGTDGCAT